MKKYRFYLNDLSFIDFTEEKYNDYNAKDCEQCNPDSICCYCKNIACYKLEEQLKRKEQEYEELKEELEAVYDNCKGCSICNEALYNANLYAKECKKLKEENERLLEEREKAKNYNLEYGQLLIKSTNEKNKLKQTLAEIKEIAEANKKYIYVLPNYSVAGDSLEFSFEFTKQIIQKINECEI